MFWDINFDVNNFLWTWNALLPATILSLIYSLIVLSAFTIAPKYLNEFTCSNCSSPVSK
jgi:hypothetical protein